jgi:uncharacterized membrane protein
MSAKNQPRSRIEREGNASHARELSRQWQESATGFLTERRAMAALSAVAIGAMTLIALYQLGILKHLPEPPLPGLDADRIDASPEAYKLLGTPDAVLGVGSYAATMTLAAMGGSNRAQEQPWLPLALASKVGFDVAQAVRLTVVQWTKFRAFCFWCLVSAATSVATAPLVFGETRAALRQLRGDRVHRRS